MPRRRSEKLSDLLRFIDSDWGAWETNEVIENIGEMEYKKRAESMFLPSISALTSPTCQEVKMAVPCICSVERCGNHAVALGFCDRHYRRQKRYGSPLGGPTEIGAPRRFLETVVMPFEGDECLPWPYATNSAGYGKLSVDGRLVHVHRLACEARWGPPPSPKHEAAHSCGKGHLGCCNPKHVSWKTPAENQRDRLAHGTAARGVKNALAKLSEEDVREIRRLRGLVSEKEIAKMFGVSSGCISGIFTGKNWSWLDDEGTRK